MFFEVYNLLFQEVFKKEQVHDKEFKLDLNELASGSYVLLVRSGNKSFTGQIQKIQ